MSRRFAFIADRGRPEQLARAVGFEPTIPDLETGALDQAKLRPCVMEYVRIGPWGRSRTADLLSHNQAFWPLNYRRVGVREAAFAEARRAAFAASRQSAGVCLPAEAAKLAEAGARHASTGYRVVAL